MAIGAVSARAGLTLRAIRLYEKMGIIRCGRGPKNVRILDAAAQEILRQIGDLKQLGLTISEIRALLGGEKPDDRIAEQLRAQLARIDEQRAVLSAYLDRLKSS